MASQTLKIFELDPTLKEQQGQIWDRVNGYQWWKEKIEKEEGDLQRFATGYNTFGFTRSEKGYTFREWLPAAKQAFLIGEFNDWENSTPLKAEEFGRWSVEIPDKADGSPGIPHKCQVRVRVETHDGRWIDRVPAWTKLAWQDKTTMLFNGVFWEPPEEEVYKMKHSRPQKPKALKIYEGHVGMSSCEPKINTYTEFADDVLPRIKRLGYNAVQLMAVAEHAHYGSFGYHVTSFFAPASRSGNPEEFRYLVDKAHGLGLVVLIDLVHAHASSNQNDGIAAQDGSDCCYTHSGPKGRHSEWDSSLFNFLKYEVLRFLLSNINYWLAEFGVDGFRFDGITSMLYHSHGIGKGYTGGYHEYFGPDADIDGHIYLMLANDLIHSTVPSAVCVAEDVSGMPTLCRPVEEGGFGFDYRLGMAIPDMWIKMLKEQSDDQWGMGHLCYILTNRRYKEGVIAYAESHDQAIVGDKTIAFWLMDAEMYTGMSTLHPASMCVDRGIALHKMIRLLVLGLGGEGYLNFMGNEFGHPEWVDFPRPENDWSHDKCRRRWDLPDTDHLRYKFLEKFDVLMHQAENRFAWCSSSYQYVTIKNDGDKVIAFERGDCLFVFNFHYSSSYQDYGIGCTWGEKMRCVLDTDEGWFGGHHRLAWGHDNPFPPGEGLQTKPHSIKAYLPARTAQVFVRESLISNGITINFAESFLTECGAKAVDLTLVLEDETEVRAGSDGTVHVEKGYGLTFKILDVSDRSLIQCAASADGLFRIYFPGEYIIEGLGVVEPMPADYQERDAKPVVGPSKIARWLDDASTKQKAKQALADRHPSKEASDTKEVVTENDNERKAELLAQANSNIRPPVVVDPVKEMQEIGGQVSAKPVEVVLVSEEVVKPKVVVPVDKPKVVEPVADDLVRSTSGHLWEKDPVSGNTLDPIRRAPSGCHLMSLPMETVEDSKEGADGALPTTYKEEMNLRRSSLGAALSAIQSVGGGLVEFARSYSTFGLHYAVSKKSWAYAEWVPGAKQVYLIGDFNGWDRSAVPLKQDSELSDVWRGIVEPALAKGLVPGSKYKLHVVPVDGEPYDSVPAWCKQVVKTQDTGLLDAVVPDERAESVSSLQWKDGDDLRIYEVHPAMARSSCDGCGSFAEVQKLLPRIARDGYTALLLLGVIQFEAYTPLGGKSMNLFAPEVRFGSPEHLRRLVKEAHGMGIRVLMSVDYGTAASLEDSIHARYFKKNVRQFEFEQMEVLRLLLGNIAYWMEEYGFDGFRFECVHHILYNNEGRWPPQDPSVIEDYVNSANENNKPAIRYLMLATEVVRALGGLTIADEHTLYPGLCDTLSSCGLGFHYRQTCSANEHIQMLLRSKKDEDWSMTELLDALRYAKQFRSEEKLLTCAEAFDDCLVGRRPLKIAMLSWETLHTIAAGGVAPHVTELAADLNKLGHEVHIFTRSTQPKTWEHEIMGVWYHEVTFGMSSDFVQEIENMCGALAQACFEWEGRTGNRFDIFHGHDWLAAKGIVQIKGNDRRAVFTMHSTETGRCGNVAYGGQSARIRDIEGAGCHVADRVICVSGVLADEVKAYYGVHGDKIRVVYNGIIADSIVNMKWEDDWSGNTKKDKGFSVMDPMFLFVGRLAVQKGPDLLLEAIPMILQARGDAKFVIVGDGHMKSALEARAGALGIGHAVYFTGSVKSGSPHLKALFKSCDAVIVPSRNEPFGIVVLEAWAAGKPVVATTCGGPRDFVTPGQDGFLVDPDPNSIAWGCCEILKDFDRTQRMGKGAQGKALNQFNWKNIASQTQEIYYEQLSLLGTPLCRRGDSGCPLASFFLGSCRDSLGVFDENIIADRGLSLHKLVRLLVGSFGGDASLTPMGSEFGFPDSFDGRSHVNGPQSYVRYEEMADEKGLRYKHLEFFEACMNRLAKLLKWNAAPEANIVVQDDSAKVIAYTRGQCLFAFNFHPCDTAKGYKIQYPGSSSAELQAAMNTDDVRFNGKCNGVTSVPVERDHVTLSLPARTAMVLVSKDAATDLQSDKVLSIKEVDSFVDMLKDGSVSAFSFSPERRK